MASRRQNSSCDQCRHSKRKCAFQQGASSGPSYTCLNCFHLGYRCTFDFITARAEQRRKRIAEREGKLPETGEISQNQHQPVSSVCGDQSAGVNLTQVNGDSNIYEAVEAELDQAILADFGSLSDLNEEWSFLAGDTPGPTAGSTGITRPSCSSSPRRLRIDEKPLSGFWSGSPIKQLNSTFTANLLGACLDDAYSSMIYGMESRYLTYTCNPFAPSHKYSFGREDQSTSPVEQRNPGLGPYVSNNPTTSNSVMQTFATTPESFAPFDSTDLPGSLKDSRHGAHKVTFVGLARFLDHFGNLYGNRLHRQTRKEDEDNLIAAQQAFAIQWSPCDTPGITNCVSTSADQKAPTTNNSQIFATAWFNVRSRILNTKPHRSFTRSYAMLLFHMTDAPEEAENATMEKNNILSQSLLELLDLKALVEDYCKHLGPTSTYRMLLESSVKVFQWFAYIKDTIASIVSDRELVLPDAPVQSTYASFPHFSPRVIGWTNQDLDDAEITLTCQKAVIHNFRLFRQIVRVKKILRESQLMADSSALSDALAMSITIVKDFDSNYGHFFDQCIINFWTLPETSKLSSGFLILFWNLGVLSLVEQVQAAHNLGLITQHCDTFSNACEYENVAIASVIAISKHIANLSANGPTRVSSGSVIKLPFISHHANPAPIVAVLVKTIEHIIQRNTSNIGLFAGATAEETESTPMETWIPSMKPLLSCLVDLDTTVAGSRTARHAFQKLMNSHSDILMDCWAVDEPELLSNWTEATHG